MSVVDQVTEIATCPICLEDFVDAKSLPCLHSFCLKCLEGHCNDKFPGHYANCPVCRTEFNIPGNGIRGLPHNFMLKKLVDAKKSTGATVGKALCDVCMKEEAEEAGYIPVATIHCADCSQNLCNPCSRPHKNCADGPHQMKPISPEERKRTSHCEKHEQKRVELYCIDCKVTLCVKCLIAGHSQHRCAEIEEMGEIFSKQIDDDVKQVRERMHELSTAVSKLDAQSGNFSDAVERVKKEIFQKGVERKKLVEKHVLELQQGVGKVHQEALCGIDEQHDSLSLALVQLESFTSYALDLKTKGSHSDIVLCADELHSQASELLQTCIVPDEDCIPVITFTESGVVNELMQKGQNIVGSTTFEGTTEPGKPCEKPGSDCGSCQAQQSEDQTDRQLSEEVKHRKCVEKQFQALTDYIHADWVLTHTITGDYEVRGLTSLYGRLDVLHNTNDDQVSVYDMRSDYDEMRRKLTIPEGDLWDITSSMSAKCLYVSNFTKKEVYKVTIGGRVTELDVCGFEPRGLSVLPNGNLLVTCRNSNTLVEVDADGAVVDIISLPGIARPWHAIQMSSGNFAVAHGSGSYSRHEVCVIDVSGNKLMFYNGVSFGSAGGELNIPCHLALDENDFVFVADCLNARVTLLTPTLKFVCHVKQQLDSRPQRLYLDRDTRRLHVGQRNGDILVIDVS